MSEAETETESPRDSSQDFDLFLGCLIKTSLKLMNS